MHFVEVDNVDEVDDTFEVPGTLGTAVVETPADWVLVHFVEVDDVDEVPGTLGTPADGLTANCPPGLDTEIFEAVDVPVIVEVTVTLAVARIDDVVAELEPEY